MKKIALALVCALGTVLAGCNLFAPQQPAALKINTTPQATVFIDGKHVGNTPYLSEDLEAGEITLKLVPEGDEDQAPWERLLELTSGVITVVNYEFGTDSNTSSGEILTLHPNNRSGASLSVKSQPDAATVRLDGESKGFTPWAADQIAEGDHQLVVASPGYKDRTINLKAQSGYRLTTSVQLAKEDGGMMIKTDEDDPTATDSADATSSAEPADSEDDDTETKATPTPKADTSDDDDPEKPYVKINETPTGWLRVRSEPSLAGEEVTKVDPGETYTLLDEKSGWYEIELESGKSGWIAGQYAEKYE